ncbi:MAG: YbjN domain-containing protein [Alphaproteobacteria bacterium]|nr:YbjN domain-containing protein [Alphaproteobacteria bacterium]
MPSLFDTLHKDTPNPLDNIEDILHANDWDFNRMGDNELLVTLAGKYGDYQLIFLWQADMTALQISVQYNLIISAHNIMNAANILMTINERSWMGHFEIAADTNTPSFRYTTLLNPENKQSYEQLESILDIALAQCETNYAAFSLLSADTAANNDTLPLALMQTQGAS